MFYRLVLALLLFHVFLIKKIAASKKILLNNIRKEIVAKKAVVQKKETSFQVISSYNHAFDYIGAQIETIASDLTKLFLIIDKQKPKFWHFYIHEVRNYGLGVGEDGEILIVFDPKSLKYTQKIQSGMKAISIKLNKIKSKED